MLEAEPQLPRRAGHPRFVDQAHAIGFCRTRVRTIGAAPGGRIGWERRPRFPGDKLPPTGPPRSRRPTSRVSTAARSRRRWKLRPSGKTDTVARHRAASRWGGALESGGITGHHPRRRGRGRGQVQGLDWRADDLAAGIAADGGRSLAERRDAAIIQVMSDALLRVSEAAALDVAEVQTPGRRQRHRHSAQLETRPGRARARALPRRAFHEALGSVAQRCRHHHRRVVVPPSAQGWRHRRPGRLGVRSIRSIIAKRTAARWRCRSGKRAIGRPHHAGALHTAPARSTRRWRQAPLPSGPVAAQNSAPGQPSAALRTSGGIPPRDTTRLAPLLPPLPDPEVVDLKQDSRYSKAHDRASDQEDQRSGIEHPVTTATATCR